LGKTEHDGTKSTDATSELIKHLNGAFAKLAADERLIFIDLNTDPHTGAAPEWANKVAKRLERYEKDHLQPGQSAYVIITNMSFHRPLRSDQPGRAIMAHGFGNDFWVPDARRISDIYRRKQKHIDIHNLIEACKKYPRIPTTFDGSLPSQAMGKGQPVTIGERYFFDCIGEKGQLGSVTTATVHESEKEVIFSVAMEDGSCHLLREPISDEALADYKAHPEAFFGAVQQVGGPRDNVYGLFEFFLNNFKNTSTEKLLELLKDAPDIEALRQMEQIDLAIEYAERCLCAIPNLPRDQVIPL
jgi:hypothetical protein